MAKPKEKIKVILGIETLIEIFIDDAPDWVRDVMSIEGVRKVVIGFDKTMMTIQTDPRYDLVEVADEIENLLIQEVPQIFKDDMKLG